MAPKKRPYEKWTQEARALVERGMSENKASEVIAEKYAGSDESVARNLRSRLKKSRASIPVPVGIPPAGSFGLLKFLSDRATDYLQESMRRSAWDDSTTLYLKALELRRILHSRLKHLDSQDHAVAVNEARSLLGRLPVRDRLAVPESLPGLERKQLVDLLNTVQSVMDRLREPDDSEDQSAQSG